MAVGDRYHAPPRCTQRLGSGRVCARLAAHDGDHESNPVVADRVDQAPPSGAAVDPVAELAASNMRAVYAIAWKHYRAHGGDLDEYISDGMAGLMRAACLYDPTAGTRFSTYAQYLIRRAIVQGYRNWSKRRPGQVNPPPDLVTIVDLVGGEGEVNEHVFEVPDERGMVDEQVIEVVVAERLVASVAVLPDRLRSTATAVMAGATPTTIADTEGVHIGTVYSRFRELRRWLTGNDGLTFTDPGPNDARRREPAWRPPADTHARLEELLMEPTRRQAGRQYTKSPSDAAAIASRLQQLLNPAAPTDHGRTS